MSTHRPERIDRSTAERLLRGEAAGPDQLVELLAAAAAPATAGELAGEESAVTAFRQAHLSPVHQLRRRSMLKIALAKLLTLKVATVAVTATAAAGGVAVAAGTGNLPGTQGGTTTAEQHKAAPKDSKDPIAGDSHPDASPSPSLTGLCRAYRAGAGDNPGKALSGPAFTHLITVAGGKDKVAGYCAGLLKSTHGKAKASSHPTSASKSHPTSAPKSHPTGAPEAHPTAAPTSHPTGAPTSHPTGR